MYELSVKNVVSYLCNWYDKWKKRNLNNKKNTGFIHSLNDIHSTYVYNKFFELLVIKNWKYNSLQEKSNKLWTRKTTLKQYLSVFDVITAQMVLLSVA